MSHTPGPWIAKGRGIYPNYGDAQKQNERIAFADIGPASGNARLIAAAPELLTALKNLRQSILYYERGDGNAIDLIEADNAAEKAIAKAEGQS